VVTRLTVLACSKRTGVKCIVIIISLLKLVNIICLIEGTKQLENSVNEDMSQSKDAMQGRTVEKSYCFVLNRVNPKPKCGV
jgi:hypothetical protein